MDSSTWVEDKSGMVEPPPSVLKHAELIEEWATRNGYKHWEIGPVASRKYCDVLIGKLHRARALLYKFSIRYATSAVAKLDKAQAEALVKEIDTILPKT